MEKRKLSKFLFLFVIIINSVICFNIIDIKSCSSPPINKNFSTSSYNLENYRHNNVTFLNPDWIIEPQDENFIIEKLNLLEKFKIKYQMIDIGYFDYNYLTSKFDDTENGLIDGTILPKMYSGLQKWIETSRKYAPDIKLIANLNGSTYLHVKCNEYYDFIGIIHHPSIDKNNMHKNIAMFCSDILKEFDLDGINLDFEPLEKNKINEDYLALIKTIKQTIPINKHMSICVNPFETYFKNDEVPLFSNLVNMIVLMDYNTGYDKNTFPEKNAPFPKNDYTINSKTYINAIKYNIKRISQLINPNCQLIPLSPGKYKYNNLHKYYENSKNHSIAVNEAILEGATVSGSGIWWFDGTSNDYYESFWFINYWINYSK